ncbi:MAG: SulP family inorganic anion transporter [Parvularculaceae bacterium]
MATIPGEQNRWRSLFSPALIATLKSGYSGEQFRNDIFGGLTAAVVALPLALAFGVASGAGPIAGLYGAIAVGFFATIFGGTPAQVSGPTGPMTVVMGAVVASHASTMPEAFTIVMLGGLIQMGFGLLGIGKYIVYTPYSVVSGFMTGIGVIIMIIQTLPFLGLPASTGGVPGTLEALASLDIATLDLRALLFASATLALIVFWPKRLQRLFPAPLAALVLGTAVAAFVFRGLPEIGEVPAGLPSVIAPSLPLSALAPMLQAGFVLALLGSIDSLLTSLVADSVTKTRHDSDKELVGQGIGNVLAGLIGGLPGAGATMRTVVNVRAGGRTPVSGALHALALLGLALGLGPLVAHVPHAILAAILMKVGWDIIDWGYLKKMRRAPRQKFVIMLITFGLTVFVDLITAVAVGIILASFVNSRWLAEEQLKGLKQTANIDELDHLSDEEKALLRLAEGKILVTLLTGTFSYASARELARRASPQLTGHSIVIYDFTHVGYVDTSAALAIQELLELAVAHGQTVFVAGLDGHARRALEGLGVLDTVPPSRRFAERREAIEAALRQLDGAGAA